PYLAGNGEPGDRAVSPWALGFSGLAAAMWVHVIVGIVVAALAAGSLWFFGNRPLSTA
ncbi:MAG: hypothetical protein E5Y60_05405, partial [Mesorhizobium sp.]